MKPQIENLGKVSVTVEQQYWAKDAQYDRLTIVEDIDTIASYISRKDVPSGIDINNREYWIPLGRVSDYLENFVEEEKGLLSYLEESVRIALEDNKEFHDTAWTEVESQVNQLTEIITTAIDTINSTNTTFNSNEVDRASAEDKRVIDENERVTKENERKAAEALRQNAETSRELAEEERQRKYTNEYDVYENNRRNAETLRSAAESARQEQEAYRRSNEESREDAESIRQGAETIRNSSETSRQQGEQKRVTAETARVTAEINRQLQEGNYSDKPDPNGSRWARFHQAQTERNNIAQEEEDNRNATFNSAETERSNTFIEAESRRDKEIENAVSILDTYETKLNNKANIDGSYSTMTVGAAETLLGHNIVTAKYTYRPTADTTDVADGVAKISSVKGNTIVWNQRSKDNAPAYNNNGISGETLNGVISLNGTLTATYTNIFNHREAIMINLNHIGYCKCTIVKDLNNVLQNKTIGLFNRAGNYGKIIGSSGSFRYKNTDDSLGWNYGLGGFTVGDVLEDVQININVFDLTQMFGEGNEPTLEEFEAMFPNDYYEYNEGELRSIEDFQIKSVGFNQWDEEWETYKPNNNWTLIKNKYPIKVIPNETYYVESKYLKELHNNNNGYSIGTLYGIRKDNTETILTPTSSAMNTGYGLYKIPENVTHIRFVTCIAYGEIYKNDISINLSHSGIRDGEYEPYQEDILPINISTIKDENGEQLFPNGLCSAGEAHDELVYDKGIGKWKAVKRIGSVDMETLNWDVGFGGFIISLGSCKYRSSLSENPNIITARYATAYNYITDMVISTYTEFPGHYPAGFVIKDSSYTDVTSFKQSLQGQILYYELATPIEVVLDDFTSNYKVSDWGTEEILMNSTPIVPVIYDVEYALNAVDTLRNMPTNYISKESLDAFLSALGSAMGGTWTATYNETNGRYDFSFSANASATELTEE